MMTIRICQWFVFCTQWFCFLKFFQTVYLYVYCLLIFSISGRAPWTSRRCISGRRWTWWTTRGPSPTGSAPGGRDGSRCTRSTTGDGEWLFVIIILACDNVCVRLRLRRTRVNCLGVKWSTSCEILRGGEVSSLVCERVILPRPGGCKL